METMLIIGLIAVVALLLRRAPQPPIIYVPLAVEEPRGGLGCLPLMVVGVLALVVIVAFGGAPS